MYERHSQPLASKKQFTNRLILNFLLALCILGVSLIIGMLGYHGFEKLSWIDSLLNASMILGGMGPVDELRSDGGKIFASLYAIYSGVVLLASVGVLIAPIFHRFLHRFHIREK